MCAGRWTSPLRDKNTLSVSFNSPGASQKGRVSQTKILGLARLFIGFCAETLQDFTVTWVCPSVCHFVRLSFPSIRSFRPSLLLILYICPLGPLRSLCLSGPSSKCWQLVQAVKNVGNWQKLSKVLVGLSTRLPMLGFALPLAMIELLIKSTYLVGYRGRISFHSSYGFDFTSLNSWVQIYLRMRRRQPKT